MVAKGAVCRGRARVAARIGPHAVSADAFDLFIIGAGSGGVRAARMAAQRGVRVAVAESAALGGTCVNLGCIPKKLYSFAAHYAESFEEARGFGWSAVAPTFDWQALKASRAREITRLNGIYGNLMTGAGATLLRGRARLVGLHEVFRIAAEYRILIYGIVLLLLVRFRPQGLLGTM